MSPPYHVNLIQGLRFFQLAAILPPLPPSAATFSSTEHPALFLRSAGSQKTGTQSHGATTASLSSDLQKASSQSDGTPADQNSPVRV
jgi:hypothetical protein